MNARDVLLQFESKTGTTPRQAADLLMVEPRRYGEYKRGTRILKPYYLASIEAHEKLSKAALTQLKKQRL